MRSSDIVGQPTLPEGTEFPDPSEFGGFMEDTDDPRSNALPVVDGVAEVPQDPDWRPEA